MAILMQEMGCACGSVADVKARIDAPERTATILKLDEGKAHVRESISQMVFAQDSPGGHAPVR